MYPITVAEFSLIIKAFSGVCVLLGLSDIISIQVLSVVSVHAIGSGLEQVMYLLNAPVIKLQCKVTATAHMVFGILK